MTVQSYTCWKHSNFISTKPWVFNYITTATFKLLLNPFFKKILSFQSENMKQKTTLFIKIPYKIFSSDVTIMLITWAFSFTLYVCTYSHSFLFDPPILCIHKIDRTLFTNFLVFIRWKGRYPRLVYIGVFCVIVYFASKQYENEGEKRVPVRLL